MAKWGSDDKPNGMLRQYRLMGNQATQTRTCEITPPGYFDGVVGLSGQRYIVSN